MNKLQSRRIEKIERIKSMITKCNKANRTIDYKKFVTEVMSQLRVTDRTAKEYIKVAKYELKIQ